MLGKSYVEELHRLGFDKVHEKFVNYDADIPPRHLYECYKNPSVAKWSAYHDCIVLCESLRGLRLTVASFNTNCFTVEFIFRHMGIWYLARITKSHNHVFPVQNGLEIGERYGLLLR